MAMQIYLMPDGIKRQYNEGEAPEGAILVTAKKAAEPEVKAAPKTLNKAVTEPKNKAVKGRKK